ncbi:MAG: YfaP family protein [Bacteroidales bacterium]
MRTIIWKLSLVLVVLMMIILACKKSDSTSGPTPGGSLTDAQKAAITSSYNQIGDTISSYLLLDGDPLLKIKDYINQAKNLPEVENVWQKDSALFVKFKNGGQVSWIIANGYIIPPYGNKKSPKLSGVRIPVGNTKACLINQQSNDEGRPYCSAIISELDQEFQDNGYETTIVNASGANLSFFQNSFSQYGAIFFISHGVYDGSRTWVLTGEEVPANQSSIEKLLNDFYLWWKDGKVSVGTVTELRNSVKVPVTYYSFSDKFVAAEYSTGSFPNSLLYLVACQSFTGTTQLAAAYNSKGVGVTIGWDETNCLGQSTGKLLFDILLGGATVGEAFDILPEDSKVDYCAVSTGANLTYFPASGKDICLVAEKNASIIINYPVEGESYSERVMTIDGYMDSVQMITSGIVEVNGVPTIMQITGSTTFSQSIVINNGINTIKVIGNGIQVSGKTVVASKQILITGTLANIDIFTELRWNTNNSDIDFHMLPPGATMADLWTGNDCCYHTTSTAWGGYLDVDNTWGYGPEHISVPSVTTPGTYRLFVHYYGDDGGGATQAFVSVSVRNGNMVNFGPYTLVNNGGDNRGDLWEVCSFEFPSGTITPVNQLTNLGKKFSNINIPAKK